MMKTSRLTNDFFFFFMEIFSNKLKLLPNVISAFNTKARQR